MNSWRVAFHKFTSFFLIVLLLFSQTVQVSFFDEVSAKPEDYRDIVSLFIDQDTYRSTEGLVRQYMRDIQTYLGSTRISLHVVSSNIEPQKIASINEKLYYEGDGSDGVSSLVGTILIGNIPIPIVHKDDKAFPSLYPYVDFEDKYFLWSPKKKIYEYSSKAPTASDVDIWHGVINPALPGVFDNTRDIPKIRDFFTKTHDFYEQKGIYNNARYTEPPRVFYYDGFYEQKSLRYDDIFAYGMYMANIENIAYKRFSKYLLTDIVDNLNLQKQTNQTDSEKALITSLGADPDDSIFPKDQIAGIPDIQTKVPIQKLIKQFFEIVNPTSLGDIRHMVYNAGRYNDGKNVRVDQPTLHITTADRVSMLTLKEANTSLENAIDASVSSFASKIALFDKETTTTRYSNQIDLINNPDRLIGDYTKTYTNYFFGKKASSITSASECSIALGSDTKPISYGHGVLVEANNAYDINTSETDINRLKTDTEEFVNLHRNATYSCFRPDTSIKLDAYWGKNTVLRLSGTGASGTGNILAKQANTALTNFSLPIFQLSGMNETNRFSAPSPLDCTNPGNQYALRDPGTYNYLVSITRGESGDEDFTCTAGFPDEWNTNGGTCPKDIGGRTPRYSCNTVHETIPSRVLSTTISTFPSEACTVGRLRVGGAVVASANNSCIVDLGTPENPTTVDNTNYKDIDFRTIPSVVYHKSPTDDEIEAALRTGATPSLAIDMDRYVEFLTPKGNLARITYPNFFRMTATNLTDARTWLRTMSENQWNTILNQENSTILNAQQNQIANILRTGNLPASPLDWNTYISDEVLTQVIESKKWLYPDIAYKYKSSIESSLSFSKNITAPNHAPFVPENTGGYEIAYLGLTSIDPNAASDNSSIDNALTDIQTGLSRLEGANVADMRDSSIDDNPNKESHKCGGPDGVDLFQWFPSIICWLQNIQMPKIQAGSCGSNTIGMNNGFGNPESPSGEALGSVAKLREYLNGSKLVISVPRNTVFLDDSLPVTAYLVKNNSPLLLPLPANVEYTLADNISGVSFEPANSVYSNGKSTSILSVKTTRKSTTSMKVKLTYEFPDKTTWTIESDPLTLRIRDEILDISPTLDGIAIGSIDATEPGSAGISMTTRNGSGVTIPNSPPYTIDIYDDIDNTKLPESGVTTNGDGYQLPFTISRKPGVYRMLITDASGRVGETTFSVHPGVANQIYIGPLSSLLVAGGKTPVSLQVVDRFGNPTIADIYDTEVEIQNGYIIDSDGKKKNKIMYSISEGSIGFTVASDTPGSMSISARIVDTTIEETKNIEVIPGAQVTVERERKPVVGSDSIRVRFKLVTPNTDIPISGFSSPLALSFPEEGGFFSTDIVNISDGVSDIITFTPGHKSGDHLLSLDIPGIGRSNSTIFSVASDIPMYIGLEKQDTTVRASLFDRYGNLSPENTSGFWNYSASDETPMVFVDGVSTIPLQSGYLWVRVPRIAGNKITVKEDDGTTSDIPAISENILYIPPAQTKYTFAPDYNALYTVLAGGSFLEEGSEILYTDSKRSASLAVTTLLDTPYTEQSLISFVPRGGYRVSQSSDTVVRPSLTVRDNFPVLEWYDDARNIQIAESVIHLNNPSLSLCSGKDDQDKTCLNNLGGGASIRLVNFTSNDLHTSESPNALSLLDISNSTLFSIDRQGVYKMSPLLKIVPREEDSSEKLVFDIVGNDETIATFIIQTDNISVGTVDDPYLSTPYSIIQTKVLGASFSIRKDPVGYLGSPLFGVSLIVNDPERTLDTEKLGPIHIASLGILPETPGVGWQESNVSMLSFAGGDTVGAANKWAHTFTMVNLGDPVAHLISTRPGVTKEGIDRSIGTKIASGAKGTIRQVIRKDMNNDGFEDIVLWYTSGYAELVLNMKDHMRSRGYIMHAADLTERGVDGGDFTGDQYADMVYLNASGSLILLDNTMRKWSRKDIIVINGKAPTGITQMKIYDMDDDGKDDIVYLSESGELAILYGTSIAGEFSKNILDSSLGVELESAPTNDGGALYFDSLPELPPGLGDPTEAEESGAISPNTLLSQIYYQRLTPIVGTPANQIASIGKSVGNDVTNDPVSTVGMSPEDMYNNLISVATDSTVGATSESYTTYVRSNFTEGHGIEVSKTYKNIAHSTVYAGDPIEVTIILKNTGSKAITNVEYLDTIPSFLSHEGTENYQVGNTTKPLEYLITDEYDVRMLAGDIPSGGSVTLTYQLKALPASYGTMIVDRLEGNEVGDDNYGDVGFKTQTTCGADMLLWRSTAIRTYQRGTKSFSIPEIPTSMEPFLSDADNNGTPDSIENMSIDSRKQTFKDLQKSDDRIDIAPQITKSGNNAISIGFDEDTSKNIEDFAQNLADGLSCGFGGGGCLSMPLNWAPMAPGNSPLLMGYPLSKSWLTPKGGPTSIPIFAGLTFMWYGPYCLPSIWPLSPLSTGCSGLGAGGQLGVDNGSNYLRIFVTPTLTMGMGTAICMGAPASSVGKMPPVGMWPATAGGNCIMITKPMNQCKADGSKDDGDVAPFTGLGTMTDSWNAGSCKIRQETATPAERQSLVDDIIDYIKNPANTKLPNIYQKISKTPIRAGGSVAGAGPLLRIGGATPNNNDFSLTIDIDTTKPFSFGDIIKVKNKSVAGFPDFLMDWVRRQMEEVTNAFGSPPNLFIVPIRSFGQNAQINGDFDGFTSKLSKAFSKKGLEDFQGAVGNANTPNVKGYGSSISNTLTSLNNSKTQSTGVIADAQKSVTNFANSAVNGAKPVLDTASSSANSMRAAYEFIGKLPFIKLERVTIPINIPWILARDLDKYGRKLKAYQSEITSMQNSWCANAPDKAACANSKGFLQASEFINSINQNLRTIEGYKKFPEKLQKYLTWKQRYLAQIVCNIDAVEKMLGGWISDNGRRFRAWVEFYILLKAILKSWNVIPDLFNNYKASCSVCRNERYDLKHFYFKLISSLIPKIPIIQFPRWPDIVLDLSDIRLGLSLRMPEFKLNVSPIRLPDLPNLSLPKSPNLTLSLPALPKLPPIPNLPDLPDLPSLPRITLPDLPPPPKLPKLFGSVVAVLNIFKLISKILCLMQSSPFVPESVVGEMIAQRTARNTTLPIDFLNLSFPQVSLKFLKEIRVSTHINFELKTDFITEMAKATVKPINSFTTDMTRIFPNKIGKNIEVTAPGNVNVKVPPPSGDLNNLASSHGPLIKTIDSITSVLEGYKDDTLSVADFKTFLRAEMGRLSPTDDRVLYSLLDRVLQVEDHSADVLTAGLQEYNTRKFSLLRDYLGKEEDSLQEFQKIIDSLRLDPPSDLVLSDALFTSASSDRVVQAEQKFMDYQSQDTTSRIRITDTDISDSRKQLAQYTSRLLAANVDPAPASIPSGGSTGYAPNFEGIFIMTPGGNQTRLFDYVTALRGDEVVDVTDIDQDGDEDYIYLMDNALYIKYSTLTTSPKIIDRTFSISDTSNTTMNPTAPNYFSENTHESGFINFDFTPANPKDRIFRLEFYDRMLEWDNQNYTSPDSFPNQKTTIDFIVDDPLANQEIRPNIFSSPLANYIRNVSSPGRTTRLFTPDYVKKITGDVFEMTPNRVFYTGDQSTQISYRIGGVQDSIVLEPFTSYSFGVAAQVGIDGGSVYIFDSIGENIITDPDVIRSMPILPNMKIFTDTGDRVDIGSTTLGSLATIGENDSYYMYNLGAPSDDYSIHIPYQNSWYYGRLFSLSPTNNTTKAGITLIAPQKAADTDAPLIDLPDSLSIPVYKEHEIDLKNAISEQSNYTLSWDNDITNDTDGNGIPDDDMESASVGGNLGPNQSQIMLLGPYDTIGERKVRFIATDEFGNTSTKDVILRIYAPIPAIQNAGSSGSIIGALDEPISDEPIDIVRVREGSPLTRFDATSRTFTGGAFSGFINTGRSGIELSVGPTKIYLDNNGWIDTLPSGYSTVVDGASETTPMKISLLDDTGKAVYSTYIITPPNIVPRSISTLTEATATGIFILPSSGFTWVGALPFDPSFAFGGYLVDTSGNAVVAVHRDGNIYPIASTVSLSYRKVDDTIHINIKNSGVPVGEVIYHFRPFYTIR